MHLIPSCGARIISECEKIMRRLSNAGDRLRWHQETSIVTEKRSGPRFKSETWLRIGWFFPSRIVWFAIARANPGYQMGHELRFSASQSKQWIRRRFLAVG